MPMRIASSRKRPKLTRCSRTAKSGALTTSLDMLASIPRWEAAVFRAAVSLTSFGDVFGDIFGGGGGGRRQGPQRGSDLRYTLEVSLEDAVRGSTAEIRVPSLQHCEPCDGSGAKPGSSPVTCGSCGGSGQVRTQQGFFQVQQTCPTCRGAAKRFPILASIAADKAWSRRPRRCRSRCRPEWIPVIAFV